MGHTLNKRPAVATTIVALPCNFEVVREDLAVPPETKETVKQFSALLENAGVEIRQTLLRPGTNRIEFEIPAQDREAAQRALEVSGIVCRGLE
jgi:hypothetical protein